MAEYPLTFTDTIGGVSDALPPISVYTPNVYPLTFSDSISSLTDVLTPITSFTPVVHALAFADSLIRVTDQHPNNAGGAFSIGHFRTTPLHTFIVTVAKRLWSIARQSVGARAWTVAPVVRKWVVQP
jgi:hypothetical protein